MANKTIRIGGRVTEQSLSPLLAIAMLVGLYSIIL